MLMSVSETILISSPTQHIYYCNTDSAAPREITEEDLKRNAKTSDSAKELMTEGLIKDQTFKILNPNVITVRAEDNAAQSVGNTPTQIKEFKVIFSESRFDPYVDLLPIVLFVDGKFITCGGYKRILGAQEASETYDNITLPCMVITPSDDCDMKNLQQRLNIIENQKPNNENSKKTFNTAESHANVVLKDIQRQGKIVENLSNDDLNAFIKPYSPSKDKISYESIINCIRKSTGVEVPEYTSTGESKELVTMDLLYEKNLDMRPYVISYDVKGKMKAEQDRLWHFINGLNKVNSSSKFTHLVIVVQHTGVTPDQAREFNEQYLQFEAANGTANEVYVGKEDKTPPVPVIFGVINNKKITYVEGSLDNVSQVRVVC